MNIQGLIERYEKFKASKKKLTSVDLVSKDSRSLDEPEPLPFKLKDVVRHATLYDALREKNFNKQYNEWLMNEQDAYNKVARAWLFGYEVEKEKRYFVKIKGICGKHETLNREKHSNKWLFSDREENSLYETKHTRKELEKAGFGWVFDCEGVEVEEVE